MAIYDWPASRTFMPQAAQLRVVDGTQRTLESPLSGYVQTVSMPGARWGWGLDLLPHASAERQAVEAWLLQLSGRQHRARLWDMKQPRPRGTIGLTGVTLGAAAAQFATSLTLAGCKAAPNLLQNSSFEADSNADGTADGWSAYNAGTFGTVTRNLQSGGVNVVNDQRVASTGLGSGAGDRMGITQVDVAAVEGRSYALSAYLTGTTGCGAGLIIEFISAANATLGVVTNAAPVLSASWARYSVAGTAPAGTVKAAVYVYAHSMPGGPSAAQILIDAAQFEQAGAATAYAGQATLLAGDWLGLSTGQLVRVVADATAAGNDAMTVEVRHMLRSAISSGTAVTLDRPTALYVRTESGLALPRQPGMVEPAMSVEFVEVFA